MVNLRAIFRKIQDHLYAVLWGCDVFVSSLTGGMAGQTISARVARAEGKAHWLCRAIDWIALHVFGQQQHCEQALAAYEARKAIAQYRA